MTVQAGNRLRITAVMSLGTGIAIENVYEVRVATTPTGIDADVMLDMADWMDDCYSELLGSLSSLLTFVEVRGFNVSAGEPLPTATWPSLTNGSSGAQVYATGVAALVLFRTIKARVLGRKFIGGFTEDAVTDGLITSGFLGALAAYGALVSAGPGGTHSSGTYDFVIYNKAGVPYAGVYIVTQAIAAYQRRRRPGRGI